jgi:hypothetical protein
MPPPPSHRQEAASSTGRERDDRAGADGDRVGMTDVSIDVDVGIACDHWGYRGGVYVLRRQDGAKGVCH